MVRRDIKHHYFFGAFPPILEGNRIHAFAQGLHGRWNLLEVPRLHMTIAITEHVPVPMPAIAAALLRAGEAVRAEPFEIVLDQLSANPGTESVVLRPARVIPAAKELHAAVREAMIAEGVPLRTNFRFSPHVTLGYAKNGPSFTRPVQPFGWKVSELVLIHSVAGAHLHKMLGRWTLEPAPEKQLSLFTT